MSTAFDPMRPDEVEAFAVDFTRRLGSGVTILAASVKAVEADDATETAIPAMISGVAGVSGSRVSQLIAGVAEGVYITLWTATTSQGENLVEPRRLTVRRDLTA